MPVFNLRNFVNKKKNFTKNFRKKEKIKLKKNEGIKRFQKFFLGFISFTRSEQRSSNFEQRNNKEMNKKQRN